MTRSPLWREFESGNGFLLKAIRSSILFGGTCFLLFAAAFELTWPQQLVFGGMIAGIAIWFDRGANSYLVTLTLVLLSVVATLRYAFWRLETAYRFFLNPATQWSGLDAFFLSLLLGAELYAFIVLFLGYVQTLWPLRRMPVPLPEDPENWPAVDLLIPTFNEPLSVVRFTALAAANIDWPADKLNVYLLDDGNREEFRRFAEEAGIGYKTRLDNRHAKAGNINRALESLDAPFFAIFDSDHVPTRSFLQVTMGWFLRDRKLGMLQTPHHFYSPDPFERNLDQFRVIPNEGELFYGIVQDGNDFWNATVFCGSCAVLRRAALDEIGGMAVETVTEDAHTSLRMQMRGWNTAYVNIPQAAGLATERLSSHIKQRIRWARGMAQIFRTDNPLFAPGLKFAQRLCYFNSMAHFLGALPRLIFLTAPLCYLILGHTNIPGYWAAIVAYALPHLLLSSLTNSRIQGQHRQAFWNEIYETVFAPYLFFPTVLAMLRPGKGRFIVTPKGGVVDSGFDTRIAQPYLVLLALNLLGVALAIPRSVHVPGLASLWDGRHPGTILMNVLWSLFNIVVLGVATAVAWESRQRRQAVRVAMRVPADILLADGMVFQGITADLSSAGVLLNRESAPEANGLLQAGTRVQLVFPVLDGTATLPATIVSAEGSSLRAHFDALDLQQQEALAMVLYSRADTWLDWRQARKRQGPLRSFVHILRFSFSGLSHTLMEMLRTRRTPADRGLAHGVSPLLLLALLVPLCAPPLLATQAPDGQTGETSPATTTLPKPRKQTLKITPDEAPSSPASAQAAQQAGQQAAQQPTSLRQQPDPQTNGETANISAAPAGIFSQSLLFAGLRGAEGLVFRGTDATRTLSFTIPRAQGITSAILHLRYAASPGLLPTLSHLKVSLNGTLFATLPVVEQAAPSGPSASSSSPDSPTANPPEAAQSGLTQAEAHLEADLKIPAELLTQRNDLTFEFVGHYAMQCEDPGNSALWAQIDASSAIEMAGPQRVIENDLSLLPAPFYEPGSTVPPSVPIVLLSRPSAKSLEAAGIVASYFGILANDRAVRFPVTLGSIPAGNVIVLAENASDLPASLQLKADAGPVLAMRANPADAASKILVLTGRNANDLVVAATVLALQRGGLQGDQRAVALLRRPPVRKPNDAPRWLSTTRRVRFSELVAPADLEGDGSTPLNLYLRLPPDLYFGPQQNLGLHLGYRYNAIPLGENSSLQVYTNGAYVSSLPLPRTQSASANLRAVVPLPVVNLRPFSNSLKLQFAFQPSPRSPCQDVGTPTLQGSVLRDSFLDLADVSHLAVLPNLELFANAGYPFTRIADLAETAVVLPDVPTVDEIEIFLTLMGHFGAQTGYPTLNVTVTDNAGMNSRGRTDFIVLGTVQDQPALARLNPSLPVQVESGGLRLQTSQDLFAPLQHAWWKVRNPDRDEPGELKIADGLPDALIEGIEWPRGSKRSVVVIVLRDHAVSPIFLNAFLSSSQSSAIAQSVSVLENAHFTSHRLGGSSYVIGRLSYAARLNLLFAEFPWIIVFAIVILSVLMAGLLRAMLRRRARARLRGNE